MTETNPEDLPDAAWRQSFRRRLLAWFRKHARDLPWRNVEEPYRVWISEIMLQQTQVATVIPYYERFLEKFPTVRDLAAADEQTVLGMWEGLGYYRRARQLHKAAKEIVDDHGGRFPTEFEQVLALPGIGRYTAGAILSIARDARLPILEANTIRLYSRLLAHREDPTTSASQKRLWAFAEAILPKRGGSGELNQALMDLGAEICRPRDPDCANCPLRMQCPTREQGAQEAIPAPKRKTRFEEVREAAVVVQSEDRVLLRRCGDGERWAGLWDFPRFPLDLASSLPDSLRQGVRELVSLEITPGERILRLKHGVTRFRITLDCFAAELENAESRKKNSDSIRWIPVGDLDETPMNTTGRKLAQHLQSLRNREEGGSNVRG